MILYDNSIKLSIIVPVYNIEKYLPKCLDSIMNQTYKNLEIILIDDGSTDNSGKICDEFSEVDKRVKAFHQQNQGVSTARNKGIDLATGEYLTFIDGDDWIEKDYFEIAIQYLNDYKPSVMINNYLRIDNCGNIIDYFNNNDTILNLNKREALIEMVTGTCYGWEPCATFYKSKLCKKVKFNINICFAEDLLFKYSILKKCKTGVIFIPLHKYYYVYRPESACNSYNLYKKVDALKVLRLIMIMEIHIEPSIRNILFYKEFIPRLITYVKEAAKSDDVNDKAVGLILQRKIKRILFEHLLNKNISLFNKIKMFICLLPYKIIVNIDKIFQFIKNSR